MQFLSGVLSPFGRFRQPPASHDVQDHGHIECSLCSWTDLASIPCTRNQFQDTRNVVLRGGVVDVDRETEALKRGGPGNLLVKEGVTLESSFV